MVKCLLFLVSWSMVCLLACLFFSIHFKWISLFLCDIWWVTFMQNILADSSQWHQTLVSFQFLSDRPFSSIHRENKTVTRTFYSMLIYKTWWWLVYPFSFFLCDKLHPFQMYFYYEKSMANGKCIFILSFQIIYCHRWLFHGISIFNPN